MVPRTDLRRVTAGRASASSKWVKRARFCWMRSRRCHWDCNRGSSRCCRTSDLSGRARTNRSRSTSAFSRPAAKSWIARLRKNGSERISITVSARSPSMCLRCASAETRSRFFCVIPCTSWLGNLKELEAFVKRYLVAGDKQLGLSGLEATSGGNGNGAHSHTLSPALFPRVHEEVEAGAGASIPKSLKSLIQSVKWETERNAIAVALEKTGWNRKAAARLLGVSYRTMLYKIDQYHMSASDSHPSAFQETRFIGADQAKGNGKGS